MSHYRTQCLFFRVCRPPSRRDRLHGAKSGSSSATRNAWFSSSTVRSGRAPTKWVSDDLARLTSLSQ